MSPTIELANEATFTLRPEAKFRKYQRAGFSVARMPFFISLYWVLLSTVEMRGAPWIGWIHDLATPDPYFILPLLMTATSLLQTWLNPTPPDPVQARMMWIMPLIFSVMFFVFPSGLVLYWLTNNILSIAQQYVINKRLGVS